MIRDSSWLMSDSAGRGAGEEARQAGAALERKQQAAAAGGGTTCSSGPQRAARLSCRGPGVCPYIVSLPAGLIGAAAGGVSIMRRRWASSCLPGQLALLIERKNHLRQLHSRNA